MHNPAAHAISSSEEHRSEPATRGNVYGLIPAFREGRHIYDVAKRVRQQLDHVLVVDDGSPDNTSTEAERAGVEVIRHESNQGKGAAIKTGLRALSNRPGVSFILLLDSDGQHLPEEIPHFLTEAARSDASMFLGNRMSDTAKMPFVRRMTNSYMSWHISKVCGQPMPDTQCGFRMLRADLAPALFTETNNFDYETEMLIITSRKGLKIASVPVSTVYGEEKSKIHPVRDTFRFIKLMNRYSRMT